MSQWSHCQVACSLKRIHAGTEALAPVAPVSYIFNNKLNGFDSNGDPKIFYVYIRPTSWIVSETFLPLMCFFSACWILWFPSMLFMSVCAVISYIFVSVTVHSGVTALHNISSSCSRRVPFPRLLVFLLKCGPWYLCSLHCVVQDLCSYCRGSVSANYFI